MKWGSSSSTTTTIITVSALDDNVTLSLDCWLIPALPVYDIYIYLCTKETRLEEAYCTGGEEIIATRRTEQLHLFSNHQQQQQKLSSRDVEGKSHRDFISHELRSR